VVAGVLKEHTAYETSGTIHPTTHQHIPEYLEPLIILNRKGNQIGLHLLSNRRPFCLLILCFKSKNVNLLFAQNVSFLYTVM
jgi:hypothetical protein